MKKSIDECVKLWSEYFSFEVNDKFQEDKIKNIKESLDYNLIEEEAGELAVACVMEDTNEIIDACGDLIWVTIRMLFSLGINPVDLINEIYESNMSKIDNNEKDARTTAELYLTKAKIETRTEIVKRRGEIKYITLNNQTNKILKSYKFRTPDIEKLIKK